MRPAFTSLGSAVAFAVLLLFLLLAPFVAGKHLLPPHEWVYTPEGWNSGDYPWIERQVFAETNDVDIAFLGSSHLWYGLDTPYLQQKLDERLGRKSVVLTLCWGGSGYDTVYYVAKDLLAHRQVKTIVVYDELTAIEPPMPNVESRYWFRMAEDGSDIAGLPVRYRANYYLATIIGMAYNWTELFTSHLPLVPSAPELGPATYETKLHAPNPELHQGAMNVHLVFNPQHPQFHDTPFVPFTPHNGVTPADIVVYGPNTATNFTFSSHPAAAWQTNFANRLSVLLQSHGCRLVVMHPPTWFDRQNPVITESQYWPDFFHLPVAMVGIPGPRFFTGLSEADAAMLYYDNMHLNDNGQKYFTALVAPTLLDLYEHQAP